MINSCTQSPISNEAKLYAWLDKNPHATTFPPHIDRIVKQEERKYRQDQPFTLSSYNAYEAERQMSSDLMGKSERFDIRQQLADYMEEGIKQQPLFQNLYGDLVGKLRIARKTGALGLDPITSRHVVAWDDKVNCVRLCPDEAREETQRLVRKYAPEIFALLRNNPTWRLYYAVYTEPNVKADHLSEGKRNQFKKFSNFHRSKWAKQRIKGSFVIQEDPLATNDIDWNVHLNAIHIVEGDFSYKELRKQWGNNVEIRQIKGTPGDISKAFLEVVKYAAKHIGEKSQDGKHVKSKGMTSWSFDQFHEWFSAGRGFRRSRTYGCLYRFEGIPDKGIDLDRVVWLGTVNHDGTRYQVNFKKNLDGIKVDSIPADNFADSPIDLHNSMPPRPPN